MHSWGMPYKAVFTRRIKAIFPQCKHKTSETEGEQKELKKKQDFNLIYIKHVYCEKHNTNKIHLT